MDTFPANSKCLPDLKAMCAFGGGGGTGRHVEEYPGEVPNDFNYLA